MLKKPCLFLLFAIDASATSIPCTPEDVVKLKDSVDVIVSGKVLSRENSSTNFVVLKPENIWRGEAGSLVRLYISPKWQELPDEAETFLVYGNWKYRDGEKVLTIPICLQPQAYTGSESLGKPIWEAQP